MRTGPQVSIGLLASLVFVLIACDGGGGGVVDAMKKADEEPPAEKKPDDGKEREIPTAELPEPTAEELAAWDRKDPEGEKHLYKWDKANAKKMQNYWKELRCLRDKMKEEGQKAFGAEPGGPEQQQWEQFKLAFIDPVVDSWQQKLFAAEGQDILTKSKYISNIIEAHELVMNGYPVAYNDGDEIEIKRQDALWTVVENKVIDYSNKIGAPFKMPDLEDPKQKEKWDKFCKDVIFPKPKKKK